MAVVFLRNRTGQFKAIMKTFGFSSVTVSPLRGKIGNQKRTIRVKISKRKGQTPDDAFNAVFASLHRSGHGGFGVSSPGDKQRNRTTISFPISER